MDYISLMLEKVDLIRKFGAAVGEWLDYSEMLEEDLETLKTKVEKLGAREEDVYEELKVIEHQSGRKRKRKEVEIWLTHVRRKKPQVEQRMRAAAECWYVPRWWHCRSVQKDIEEVTELLKEGRFKRGLWIDECSSKGVEFNVPSVVPASAKQKIDEIWKCLMNDQTTIIGVYGMGGVGKTIIAFHINNRLLGNNSFDHVFWVTVPRQSNIYDLQNFIAKTAGLDLSGEEDNRKRAAKLFKYLERKKFVLILDDIWKIFPLDEVGIPLAVDRGKLLLTTRNFDVCRGMQCQEEIEVRCLSAEESWNLFSEEHGSLSPQLKEYAKSVANKCAGVPLAIVTIAKSMRREEELSVWRNALNELQHPTMDRTNMSYEIFTQLKFSYDHLGHERLRHCLLYCALFPEDWEIERNEIIAYWIGERLIRRKRNRQAEFDMGNAIIKRLTDACLLETTKQMIGRSFIKMNKAVRDMALAIATENPLFMVKAGVQLTEFPSQKEWSKTLNRVSLMRNYLKGCSSLSPNCPMLRTILLQHNDELDMLPHSFFVNFQSLYVLDLSGSNIVSLPDTIVDLEKLRVLILRGCKLLEHIPPLYNKLQNLLELDLGSTGLCRLPEGVEKLVNLRVLDLSWTRKLRPFPNLLLVYLHVLQCLRIEGHAEVQKEAIALLERLETLHIDFSDIHAFTSYLKERHWRRLVQYCFVCGLSEHQNVPYENLKTVILSSCHSIGPEWETTDPLILPDNMEQLLIDNCSNITSLLHLLQALRGRTASAQPLARLNKNIIECYEDRSRRVSAFWRSELEVFANLQSLKITRCPNLKYLFSYGLADITRHLLDKLNLLQVCDCSDLEEIIETEESSLHQSSSQCNNLNVVCPRHLVLRNLPKLNSIYRRTMLSQLVEEIEVVGCPMLRRLPFSMREEGQTDLVMPRSLRKIQGQREWWNSLEWDHPDAESVMQNIFCESNE